MSASSDSTAFLVVRRGVRSGWLTFVRERTWFTGICALLGVVLVAQVFVVLCFGTQSVRTLLLGQGGAQLLLRDAATDRQVQEFLVELRQLPYVSAVEYVTREKALENARSTDPGVVAFLEGSKTGNPLHDSVTVSLLSISAYDKLSSFLAQARWNAALDSASLPHVTAQQSQAIAMLQLADAGRAASFILLLLTAAILLGAVVALIRHRSLLRRQDLFVERMAGASEASLVLSFATETTILLFITLVVSIVCITLVVLALPSLLPTLMQSGMMDAVRTTAGQLFLRSGPSVLLLEFLLIPVLGYLGAFLGTRQAKML